MKSLTLVVLSVLLTIGMLMAACTPAPASTPAQTTTTPPPTQAKTIELKLSHLQAATSNPDLLCKYLADKISERTNGRVKITVFAAGVLTQPNQGLDAVKTGTVDMVFWNPAYTPGRQPSCESFQLPIAGKNTWAVAKAAADFNTKFNMNSLKEFEGVHFLSFGGFAGPAYLATKAAPAHTPADLKGLKLLGAGMRGKVEEAWGATVINFPMAEVYDNLSKGVIDGGLLPGEALKSWKLAEVTKYITLTPGLIYNPTALLMNTDKWNSLSPDIQKVFNDTMIEYPDWDGKVWWYSDSIGLDFFKNRAGNEVYEVPAADQSKWDSVLQPIRDAYIKANPSLKAADYVSYIQERCDYWNGQMPDKQAMSDWVEKEVLKLK